MLIKNGKKLRLSRILITELLPLLELIKPELYSVLKTINLLDNDYHFYKASYRFGDKILHNKELYFTTEDGESLNITNEVIPNDIYNDLNYDLNIDDPLAMFLNKTSEGVILKDSEVIDSILLKSGDFIGIPRALNSGNIARSTISNYEINAGCRSLFMLSKIGDKKIYQKITKILGYEISIPQSMEDHWQTFAEISNNQNFFWSCEVIFFPRRLIRDLSTQKLSLLNICLSNIHYNTYNMKHSHASIWNIIYFISIEKNKLLNKYNQQYLNIIRHIFMLCSNSAIGFAPITSNEPGPINDITKFFKTYYGLNSPIIMGPNTFNYMEKYQNPVYLSLNYQQIMLNANDVNKYGIKKTNISILSDIKYLYGVYEKYIREEKKLNQSILFNIVNNIKIEYFNLHNNTRQNSGLINCEQIINGDSRFAEIGYELNAVQTSSFFNGGIKITKISND